MNDGESRSHLLAVCTTLRDYLKQTEKLTSAVEMLLSRDPELRVRYEAEQKKERDGEDQGRGIEPVDTASILLRLQQEIQTLSGENGR